MTVATEAPKLYQYEACPFCAKVRALLRYKGVPFDAVEVHALNKKELEFSKDYKKVPVLVDSEGRQHNDSSEILRYLDQEFPDKSVFDGSELEATWLKWADEVLVKALPPLIYRNFPSSLKAFGYITKVGKFTWAQQRLIKYAGAAVMTMVAKKGAKRQRIADPIGHFVSVLKQWETVLRSDFLGGDTPNAADIATYGYLKSIENMPAFRYVEELPRVLRWYRAMNQLCQDR